MLEESRENGVLFLFCHVCNEQANGKYVTIKCGFIRIFRIHYLSEFFVAGVSTMLDWMTIDNVEVVVEKYKLLGPFFSIFLTFIESFVPVLPLFVILIAIAGVLSFILIGLPFLLVFLAIFWIAPIIGIVKAISDRSWDYPIVGRWV